MTSRILATILCSIMVHIPLNATALDLGDLKSLNGKTTNPLGDTNVSGIDMKASQADLVKQYASAGKSVLMGNAEMADAVGLKTKAAAARAAGNSLTEGSTKGTLSDADKASSETNDAVAAALKNGGGMDAASKAKFSEGMKYLGQGLLKYTRMSGPIANFTNGLKTVSPTSLPSLESGAYVASTTPTSVKNLTAALKNAVEYSRANDIAVPKDATDALSKI
jgi:hypothetical protein